MEKKSILIIIIIMILMGAIVVNNFSNQKHVEIGDAKFTIPYGYHEEDTSNENQVSITDGKNHIGFQEHKDNNINSYVNNYVNYIQNQNHSVKIENFTIDNTVIYKATNTDYPDVVHYWFVKNNKTYDISKSQGKDSIDTLVINLIDSVQISK